MFVNYVKGFQTNAPSTSSVFDPTESTISGVWLCPAVNGQVAAVPGWWWPGYTGNTWSHYSYFSGTSQWPITNNTSFAGSVAPGFPPNLNPSYEIYNYGTNPADLLDTRFSAGCIVMADSTVWIGNNNPPGWCFNHAIHGGARPIFDSVQGTIIGNQASINDCRGMNELFADGHVVWNAMSSATHAKLAANPTDITVPHVAADPNSAGSWLTFY